MNPRIFGSISFLALTAAALWACHSSSSNSDDTSGGLSGACQRVANATSAFAQKCGGQLTAVGAKDRDTHDIERSAALCVAEYSLPGISDPTKQLNACAADLAAAPCNTEGLIPSCSIAPSGSLTNGTTCAVNEQCAGGVCIFSVSDAGSAADASPVACGTCETATVPGQLCTDPTLCVGGVCEGNSPDAAVCQPSPTQTSAIGATCGDFTGCAPPGFCAFDSNGNSGTCTAPAKLGESCGTGSIALQCEPSSTCTNSVCTAPAALGEDCTSKSCGTDLFCSGGRCLAVTYGPVGASCDGVGLKCVQGNCPNASPFG
ncbi:MAG: hypothetical protein ABI183_05275, partial [Polyangiaceae bacterium]